MIYWAHQLTAKILSPHYLARFQASENRNSALHLRR